MDDKDKKIVEILMENARESYIGISKKVGLSEGAIRKRVKKLLDKGIIMGFQAKVNPRKVNLIESFTGIDVDPENLIDVLDKIYHKPEIRDIYLTSGDHNLILRIIVDSIQKMKEIHSYLESLPGVKRICPAIVTEVIK